MTYFDFAATTPMSKNALKTYSQVAREFFGNPSSHHAIGLKANGLLMHCRETIADLIHVPKQSLIFTSGGSEGNELAIRMSIKQLNADKNEILVSPIEHASVHHILASIPDLNIKELPLNKHGQLTPELLQEVLTPQTGLIILQAVNSVTGIIQPIDELATIAKQHDVLFHCDGVQAFTKYTVPFNVTSYSASSHKIYGPKGTGLLYLNPRVGFTPLFPGVTHEFGFRQGTVDLPSVAAFTTAIQDAFSSYTDDIAHYKSLRTTLIESLPTWENMLDCPTYPGIIGLFAPVSVGNQFIDTLHEFGYCVSSTSACNDLATTDPALLAIGISPDLASRFVRISFGKTTTVNEVLELARVLNSL
ncbi:MAG: IscS subfamily cysteine desulfurase [Lactobacillaceae bacterium]|jgi:cysteine desulfurase|nr:IscS subfamily cysteine desulfurase [Lactobacillaceae bacterium]